MTQRRVRVGVVYLQTSQKVTEAAVAPKEAASEVAVTDKVAAMERVMEAVAAVAPGPLVLRIPQKMTGSGKH